MFDNIKKSIKRKKKIREKAKHSHKNITTLDLIKRYLDSKIPKPKEKAENPNISLLPGGADNVNYIAVVLDGRVEDVIRTQNRMAALLLSEPIFVEFDPKTVYPQIGVTEYKDGAFVQTSPTASEQENKESEEF
jgi:hypothetical protein